MAENVLVENTRDNGRSPVSGNVCESERDKASEGKVAKSWTLAAKVAKGGCQQSLASGLAWYHGHQMQGEVLDLLLIHPQQGPDPILTTGLPGLLGWPS